MPVRLNPDYYKNIRIIQKGQLIESKKQASTFENFAKLMAA
ncbi:protein of unknown function [Cardinium endosymbiont cEper1 of Encarsia pergandiella]|nr:protein of unknown function [Cardinium endosymbiont cEper1 of Encarsia pergandiella]